MSLEAFILSDKTDGYKEKDSLFLSCALVEKSQTLFLFSAFFFSRMEPT